MRLAAKESHGEDPGCVFWSFKGNESEREEHALSTAAFKVIKPVLNVVIRRNLASRNFVLGVDMSCTLSQYLQNLEDGFSSLEYLSWCTYKYLQGRAGHVIGFKLCCVLVCCVSLQHFGSFLILFNVRQIDKLHP